MKAMKFSVIAMAAVMMLSSCGDLTNKVKGAMIGTAAGGAAGTGLGAAIGALAGGKQGAKIGASIGAGVGVAAGATAGTLIGKKMDKAKAAAQAALAEQATVETTTDANGLDAIKVTFDSGILFQVGQSTLQPNVQNTLNKFANNVLKVYTDCDIAICGFASSDGSDATNLTLSQARANSVSSYLTGACGVSAAQVKSAVGYGEAPEYLILNADGTENREASRRVEVYLYASKAMIEAANAGTLQ